MTRISPDYMGKNVNKNLCRIAKEDKETKKEKDLLDQKRVAHNDCIMLSSYLFYQL